MPKKSVSEKSERIPVFAKRQLDQLVKAFGRARSDATAKSNEAIEAYESLEAHFLYILKRDNPNFSEEKWIDGVAAAESKHDDWKEEHGTVL